MYKQTHIVEGKTLAQWSVLLNVKHATLRQRLLRTGTIHKTDARRKERDPSTYASKGPAPKLYEGKSIKQWSEELGITKGAISQRIKKYGGPTCTKPPKQPKEKAVRVVSTYEGLTVKEWAVRLNMSTSAVYERINRYGTPNPVKLKIPQNAKCNRNKEQSNA